MDPQVRVYCPHRSIPASVISVGNSRDADISIVNVDHIGAAGTPYILDVSGWGGDEIERPAVLPVEVWGSDEQTPERFAECHWWSSGRWLQEPAADLLWGHLSDVVRRCRRISQARQAAYPHPIPASPLEYDVNIIEWPAPTTRTVRIINTLQRAGVRARAILWGDRGVEATRRAGIDTQSAERDAPWLRQLIEWDLQADLAPVGTAAARRRDLAADLLNSDTPAIRLAWGNLYSLPFIWRNIAREGIEYPAPIWWAADVDALPPAVWAASVTPQSRVIFDAHELLTELEYLDPDQKPGWERICRNYLPLCDEVITVGDDIAKEYARRYELSEVRVLESKVLSGVTPPQDIRTQLGLAEDIPLIVHTGNVTPHRRVELGIDALVHLPLVHCAALGSVKPDYADELREYAASRGVAERFHIVPPVPLSHLRHFLTTADVGLILYSPGVSENLRLAMPNKLFEYLAAGLPTIATGDTSAAHYLEREGLGLGFDDGSSESLVRSLKAIFSDRQFAERVRPRMEEFVWESQADEIVDLFASHLEKARWVPLR